MESASVVIIPEPTQEDYKNDLRRMYAENYQTFRKNELQARLLAYFYFLEREIKWVTETEFPDNRFSIAELVAIIGEAETLLEEVREKKRRSAEILAVLWS